MFHVDGDKSKQLLTINYSGHVGADEMPLSIDKIKGSLSDMQPGFCLLVDFSNMEFMDSSCGVYIGQIMDLCSAKRVSAVARVIPDQKKDIGLYILSCFHYGPKVQIMTHENLEQAMQSLAT